MDDDGVLTVACDYAIDCVRAVLLLWRCAVVVVCAMAVRWLVMGGRKALVVSVRVWGGWGLPAPSPNQTVATPNSSHTS